MFSKIDFGDTTLKWNKKVIKYKNKNIKQKKINIKKFNKRRIHSTAQPADLTFNT